MHQSDFDDLDSTAHALAALVFTTDMPTTQRLEFLARIAQVRRMEITLNETTRDAQESDALSYGAPNVVHVDFARGRG